MNRTGRIAFSFFMFLLAFTTVLHAQIDTVRFNKYYFKKYWTDAKTIVTFPVRWKDSDWTKLGAFVAAEVGMSFADQPIKDFAQAHRDENLTWVSRNVLEHFGSEHSIIVMSGLFTYGLVFKNQKCQSTGLLAFESFVMASLVTRVPKTLIGRERPDNWQGHGPYTFNGPFGGNSFPSGHTTASFAVASVIATQFRDIKWVPYASYGIATMAGLSRVYDNKHWFTDVVAGATVGIVIGNMVCHRVPDSRLTLVPFTNGYIQGVQLAYRL